MSTPKKRANRPRGAVKDCWPGKKISMPWPLWTLLGDIQERERYYSDGTGDEALRLSVSRSITFFLIEGLNKHGYKVDPETFRYPGDEAVHAYMEEESEVHRQSVEMVRYRRGATLVLQSFVLFHKNKK